MSELKNWHIVLGGFLQTKGTANGMISLWQELLQFSDSETCVHFDSWNANCGNLAELIWRAKGNLPESVVNVNIYCYSWGGTAAIKLAAELQKRGINVQQMIMCDPVYRPSLYLFKFLAMTDIPVLTVPTNVKTVVWFKQNNPRFNYAGEPWWKIWKAFHPAGHEVEVDTDTTTLYGPKILTHQHIYCDDSFDFRNTCLEVAEKSVEPKR